MKNFPRMLFFLLGYILCIGDMASLNYLFVDAERLQSITDFEIEEQLNDINKSAANIIKTKDGDTCECIDFYKQPAFDHPSMKNHLFDYEMHRISSFKNSRTEQINHEKFGFLWENGVGCPLGTIPIQRVTKDELLRINSFSDKDKPQGSWNFTNYHQYSVDNAPHHHFAVARTKRREVKHYNGASMVITINDPLVKSSQFSSARMHIQIGEDYIQVGWTVNPKLYPDTKTRTFAFTKAGKNECYNSMCPVGIIMVRTDLFLGMARGPPDLRGSRQRSYDTYGLQKDKANGYWWLMFEGEQIGFWPAKLFQQSFANSIEWGGEVYSASMLSPQMGNGYFPLWDPEFDAHICNITIVDENFKIDNSVKNIETFSDDPRGYEVHDDLYSGLPVGHIIYYGGPGNI
ncbi:Protein neprosin [Cardamine amara subsp. amara]|uniref:Protein neprosin n=1 Tax=Cardamine amara subsp. amara TaxID=228776 RepID=A0ABD0ZRI0_CARAN